MNTESLLQRLLVSRKGTFDRAAARRAVREVYPNLQSSSPVEQLVALADILDRLGQRGKSEVGDMEAFAIALGYGPAVVCANSESNNPAWILIRGRSRNKLQIASNTGPDRWISWEDFVSLLLPVNDSQLAWLQAQPAVPAGGLGEKKHTDGSKVHHGTSHAAHASPLSQTIELIRPEATDIWIVVLFAAVVGILGMATPIAVEALVNSVAFGRFVQPVIVISIMLLGFLGFAAILKGLQVYIVEILQRRLFVRVACDLAYRLPRADKHALESENGHELVNRFFDVMTIQKSIAMLVLDGTSIVLQTTIGMIVLAFYHPLLAGLDLLLILFLGVVVLVLGRGAVKTAIEESKAKYDVQAWLEELALFPVTYKSFGGRERAIDHADRLTVNYIVARKKHFRVLMGQVAFNLGLQALAGSLILGLGGWLVINMQLTLGQLVAAELIVALIVGSFAKLGKQLEVFYDLLAGVDKVGHLLHLPMEKESGATLAPNSFGIAFKAVAAVAEEPHSHDSHHSHASGHEHHGFTLEATPGALVAIMGPPSSGKSTFLDLLYGLRTLESGLLELDQVEIRSLQPSGLRKQITLLRNVEILTGTVSENVHLDRIDVTYEEVRGALQGMLLYEDVLALPDGLETELTPVASAFSGSKGTRLMLARALVARPRLLLIDGMLDSVADDLLPGIFETLQAATKGCTIVIVTGRHDIAALCDQVVSLGDDGSPSAHKAARELAPVHH